MTAREKVIFSILIGRVSTEDRDRILQALDALQKQNQDCPYEVVLADRLHDEITEKISVEYPEVVLIRSDKNATLPAMRADALVAATGAYIIVTEDHCVPGDGWLRAFYKTLLTAPDDVAAVGGCVENGVFETPLDWATFLCEYSGSVAPASEGYADDVPGMNVAYRRTAFEGIDESLLRRGFWETTLHPILRQRGQKFYSSNTIRLNHCKKFSLALFCRQRYVYSRYYAGIRFPPNALSKRLIAMVLSVALPPLLLWRMRTNLARKNRLGREFLTAVPYLALFVVIWAAGEIAGYVTGPGGALAEIE